MNGSAIKNPNGFGVIAGYDEETGEVEGYMVDCPGCKQSHFFNLTGKGPKWQFDGNPERPTFSPSLHARWTEKTEDDPGGIQHRCCHFFLRDGVFEFLDDCTHDKAGQKVPMEAA